MDKQKTCIIYLHGFISSPLSTKAQQLKVYLDRQFPEIEYHVPDLKFGPQKTIDELKGLIELLSTRQIHLVGSSLGGYYATYLANYYNLRAALVNPAVRPYELISSYLGENHNPYTGETFWVTPQHVAELKALDVTEIRAPENFFLLVQTDDEVLDYQEAVNQFSEARLFVQPGGSHAFDDFDKVCPQILEFFSQ